MKLGIIALVALSLCFAIGSFVAGLEFLLWSALNWWELKDIPRPGDPFGPL
jgi:hypothetical protein